MNNLLEIITGPWGVLAEKAIFVLLIIGAVFFVYKDITGQASQSQMLRDQNAQIVQLQKDDQNLQKNLANLQKDNTIILAKLDQENQRASDNHDVVTHYIESPQGQQSNQKPVPDVISNTIGMLRNDQ